MNKGVTSDWTLPAVTIVMPCRNEKKHIASTISSILAQDGIGERFSVELLVVDGMSDDGTRDVVEDIASRDGRVRLVDNPKRITPVAMNTGIKKAGGKYVCILGAHADIEKDYLVTCLETIEETGADDVGGPWRARGEGYIGKAVALAFQSMFCAGGARSHNLGYEGLIDSVWGGFYRREVFNKVGMFDEELVRNQDDELNFRLLQKGCKIWQSPRIRYSYICRDSLKQLARQYYQYGFWKVRVIQKHNKASALRHYIPGAFVAFLMVSAVFSIWLVWAQYLFLIVFGAYCAANLLASFIVCAKPGNMRYLPIMPIIMAVYHFSYGLGFLSGLIKFLLFRRKGMDMNSRLSR